VNLLLLEEKDFIGLDRVVVSGRRFMHLKKVIRAEPGTALTCGKLNGKMGTGRVTAMDKEQARLEVVLDQDPPTPLPLTLVLALPRPKMLKRILQAVSSLGVKQIFLINSWRVEKSFWSTDLLAADPINRHLKLGLEQARDTLLPAVYLKRYFTAFVKEELPGISKGKPCFLAHPKTHRACPVAENRDAVLVIGPEGGFIDLEVDTLKGSGAIPVHIGPRILRVETAVSVLISRLFS
jgi:RsmE family RNA methyltransferase